jgi:carboxypeptidase family protein
LPSMPAVATIPVVKTVRTLSRTNLAMSTLAAQAFAAALLLLNLGLVAAVEAVIPETQLGGRISGVVVDLNDARIVGARISLKSERLSRTIYSSDEGEFEVEVPIGSYDLIAEARGFKTTITKDLQVRAGETISVSVKLFPSPPPEDLYAADLKIEPQNAFAELSRKIEKRKLP